MATQHHPVHRGDGRTRPATAPAAEPAIGDGRTRHTIARAPEPAVGDGRTRHTIARAPEPAVGDLIRQLRTDGAALLRNEVALAKLEIRDMAREVVLDSARVFGAIALALAGALALLTAAIVALGNLLDGRYALAALIVGAIMFAIGALLARSGIAGLMRPPKPEHTVATLRSTSDWARDEISEFKEEIRS